ncbi:beta-1,3-galactosyltransferase 1-like isoform X2 [Cyprinodon tularosa]|nr:beta-1,3-galactosyltransferase 1-like isoform X2 [Cyprinodon tularosa]XP_038151861.1 beta-1,3-galactosyltransferase 1-like isoform X2 [Cyprinodon tularosa]
MKGTRRWIYYFTLSLIMGIVFLYHWSSQASMKIWFSRTSDNNGTTAESISPYQGSPSQFFVEYPHPYRFILDEPDRCGQESPFLVVIIPVAPHNREARDIIRSTWGGQTQVLGQLVTYYFILGKSRADNNTEQPDEQILAESQDHHDILQSNFLDSYKNLTIKTMVMLEWLTSHCPKTSYAMKIDSDTFLNVHNLVEMLLKAPCRDYMTGLVARDAIVLRDPSSKWFLSLDIFPEYSYPPYALGLGYVFSLDLPNRILEASRHVKALYIEDVYVGLCMRHVGAPLTDPPHNGLFIVNTPPEINFCYLASVVATLLKDSKQILDVWKVYKTQPKAGC